MEASPPDRGGGLAERGDAARASARDGDSATWATLENALWMPQRPGGHAHTPSGWRTARRRWRSPSPADHRMTQALLGGGLPVRPAHRAIFGIRSRQTPAGVRSTRETVGGLPPVIQAQADRARSAPQPFQVRPQWLSRSGDHKPLCSHPPPIAATGRLVLSPRAVASWRSSTPGGRPAQWSPPRVGRRRAPASRKAAGSADPPSGPRRRCSR